MKEQAVRPFAIISETVETVKIAISVARDFRRRSEQRRAGKRDTSVLPL